MNDCCRRHASRKLIRQLREAYANAPQSKRLEYGRYVASQRRNGKRPMIFYDWQSVTNRDNQTA